MGWLICNRKDFLIMENNQTTIANAETGVDQTDTTTVTDTTTDTVTTGEMLTMPKADYDKALQSAEDKIRSAKTKEIKALQAKIAELAPIEKTAADIELEKRLAKLEERETAAAEKERMINIQSALTAKGLDKSLANYLKSEVDIESFGTLIDGIINERAKGNAYVPTGHQNNVGMTKNEWAKLSYSEKENFASNNPDLAKTLMKKKYESW